MGTKSFRNSTVKMLKKSLLKVRVYLLLFHPGVPLQLPPLLEELQKRPQLKKRKNLPKKNPTAIWDLTCLAKRKMDLKRSKFVFAFTRSTFVYTSLFLNKSFFD